MKGTNDSFGVHSKQDFFTSMFFCLFCGAIPQTLNLDATPNRYLIFSMGSLLDFGKRNPKGFGTFINTKGPTILDRLVEDFPEKNKCLMI